MAAAPEPAGAAAPRMAALGLPEFRATQTGPPRLPGQGRTQQPSCSGLASPCMAAGGGRAKRGEGRDGERAHTHGGLQAASPG